MSAMAATDGTADGATKDPVRVSVPHAAKPPAKDATSNDDAVWAMTSPHAQWTCAPDTVTVSSHEVTCTLHDATVDTRQWLDRMRHGVLLTQAPVPGTWLATLVDEALVHVLPAQCDVVPAFGQICDDWVRGIFAAPFWTRFLAGESSDIQVLAFLAQLYHRAAGADVHNRIAVERCTDSALRPLLLRQYREQRGQSTMLAAGLLRCGPAARTFLDSGAFDATHALIDFIIGAAGDMPAYVGCCALCQAPAAVRAASEIEAQFDALAKRYPSAADGFAAVCAHARHDASVCGGTALLSQWVEDAGEPDVPSRLRMLRGAYGVAAAYRVMFDALYRLDEAL
ncbi:hypothetical protein AB870_06910 [Pandoraea faecigallinarum]|uniref:Uncharacterized protein n=1 Tax=Pandoraea faecigallinarum TaxID=656179 RepID=A0A0H3WTH8_9BURK|nr:hypothetical protein [Pandoraea faecigallinarum]AKM29898.1 hypothetical protein AB870_06910 [Pandoraea faecigallinarum]